MGFLDKAKAAATSAVQQGQAKVATYQQGRSEQELHRALGEAVYNEQRHGGDHAAVEAGLSALDQHYAEVAQAASAAAAAAAPVTPTAPPPVTPTAPGQPVPPSTQPAGNFTLDDL